MSLPTILFCILAAADIVVNIVMLIFVTDDDWDLLPKLFNPIIIYKAYKVNYFGCFMLMIFYHAIFSPFAIGYWIYMLGKLFVWLCAVGRR
jgi:hypothetical protein